ncbi:MAG: hypothetical protein EOP38_27020, partial [Rubrivivax sp.]
MNHIFSIVRTASTQQTQAVPETARQRRGGPGSGGGRATLVALVAVGAAGVALAGPGPVLGVAGSCQEVGTFTVSNARSPMCELTDNDHVTVTSTGSITGAVNAIQIGIPDINATPPVGVEVVNQGALYGTSFNGIRNYGVVRIDNTGSMGGLNSGISNSGLITRLDNSSTGQIEGLELSGIQNYQEMTELYNAGLIRAVNIGYGIDNPGVLETINNSGVISGPDGAIRSTRRLDTINNSGQLLGSVSTDNTVINLSGTAARITGAVANTGGSVNLLGGADFTTENTFVSDVFVVNSGATLRVGSSAHSMTVASGAADAFRNAGTLRVGEGVVANVVGNYSQSGAVRLG